MSKQVHTKPFLVRVGDTIARDGTQHYAHRVYSLPWSHLAFSYLVHYNTASRKPCWKQSLAAIASWGRDLSYSRKLSQISAVCGYSRYAKVSPQNLGHGILWCGKSEQSAKVFSTKIIFFTNLRKFSPSKVFRYAVVPEQYIVVVWQSLPKKREKKFLTSIWWSIPDMEECIDQPDPQYSSGSGN